MCMVGVCMKLAGASRYQSVPWLSARCSHVVYVLQNFTSSDFSEDFTEPINVFVGPHSVCVFVYKCVHQVDCLKG